MARITKGSPLIGASGRIGNLVTYDLNGVQVIRALPYVRKRKPSDLQKMHRLSFKVQHAVTRSIKHQIINRIWSKLSFTGGMNAYNQFIKTNRAAYGQTDRIVFPELMVISQGNLFPAQGVTIKKDDANLVFTWEAGHEGKYASGSDRFNVVILSRPSSLTVIETDVIRKTGQAILPIPYQPDKLTEGYLFWSSENDKNFSPSVYWICS